MEFMVYWISFVIAAIFYIRTKWFMVYCLTMSQMLISLVGIFMIFTMDTALSEQLFVITFIFSSIVNLCSIPIVYYGTKLLPD